MSVKSIINHLKVTFTYILEYLQSENILIKSSYFAYYSFSC